MYRTFSRNCKWYSENPRLNVAMIPNGCDLSLVNYAKKSESRQKFKAVFTGAHGYANGLDAVLDVAMFCHKMELKIFK